MPPEAATDNRAFLALAAGDAGAFDYTNKRAAFRAIALAGGSLSDTQVGQCKFARPFRFQGSTFREMIAAGSYVPASMNFALARNPNNGFLIGTNTQQGNAIVINKVGLMSRPDTQLVTYQEIVSKGYYSIAMPTNSSNPPIDNRPILDLLASLGNQVGVPALAAAAATTVAATTIDNELSAGMASFGRLFEDLPPIDQPIFLVNGQFASLNIAGLAGTAAGTTPLWGVVPVYEGWELVGLTS